MYRSSSACSALSPIRYSTRRTRSRRTSPFLRARRRRRPWDGPKTTSGSDWNRVLRHTVSDISLKAGEVAEWRGTNDGRGTNHSEPKTIPIPERRVLCQIEGYCELQDAGRAVR